MSVDLYQLNTPSWSFRVPTAFQQATLDLKTAFFASMIFTMLTHGEFVTWFLPMLSKEWRIPELSVNEARAVTSVFFVVMLLWKRYKPLLFSPMKPDQQVRAKRVTMKKSTTVITEESK